MEQEKENKHNILILTMTAANKEGNDKEQEKNNDACIAQLQRDAKRSMEKHNHHDYHWYVKKNKTTFPMF